jgi:hypothetical protein
VANLSNGVLAAAHTLVSWTFACWRCANNQEVPTTSALRTLHIHLRNGFIFATYTDTNIEKMVCL